MGLFDDKVQLFTVYDARVVLRDKLIGGVPKDPRIIEGWLKSKAGIEQQQELRTAMIRTLREIGEEMPETTSTEALDEAMRRIAGEKQTCGFKRNATDGLYYESRCLKAGIKESVNILYAGTRWGKTAKGPRSFLAERVFVRPDVIPLRRTEPDGVELFIGHVTGPKGAQSNLTYYEHVRQATLDFQVWVAKDEVPLDAWPLIWVHMQENGIGALRSQGYGTFDITRWEKRGETGIDAGKVRDVLDREAATAACDTPAYVGAVLGGIDAAATGSARKRELVTA